jgi:hypothetical protein
LSSKLPADGMCRAGIPMVNLSYVLPVRATAPLPDELIQYLQSLDAIIEVIVVDGSHPDAFRRNAVRLGPAVRHLAPHQDLLRFANGKVAGVVTGFRVATRDCIVIADDDVRHDAATLAAMAAALETDDVVRPQNYFEPMPWHAYIDTARSLLNRISGGDWPGTLGVRRAIVAQTQGYDGDVLFENLELVRTIRAAGGREAVLLGIYVRRVPPSVRHFWSQRVRQAYDEFARPFRLAIWLAFLPGALAAAVNAAWRSLAIAAFLTIAAAEVGRWRAGGRRVFPFAAALCAPLWIAERSCCAWMAVALRLVAGGVRYHGHTVLRAATPMRLLRERASSRACYR